MSFNFVIDLPAHSDWGNIDLLRGSVLNCFTAMFRNVDGCHTLAMITGELLENAVKYGAWEKGHTMFRLRVWGADRSAFVCVENPIEGRDDDAKEILDIIAWIKSFPSAEEAYRSKLLEIAAKPVSDGSSRLGLVRVAYEGSCHLSAVVEGDMLSVTAQVPLTSDGAVATTA